MGYNWVRCNAYSGAPNDAVIAGHDIDGATIFVGRAFHEGDMIPAKVMPSKRVAYVPYGGSEVSKHDFEVLCGTGFTWVQSASGHVPADAVLAGNQSNGEQLFVGRANVGGCLTTGKVHPSHNCIYVPFGGTEHCVRQYEVLVHQRRRSTWVPSTIHSQLPAGAIQAGHDQDGSPIYVGRAWHGGDQIPAKVLPTKHACYIAFGGQEILKDSFEVLCHGNISWVRSNPRSRSVPPMSLTAGVTSEGEPLYIGRAHHNGSLTVGKVQISHGALYIPFGGSEVPIHSEIEVLVEH